MLFWDGLPELVMVDVPPLDIPLAVGIMNTVAAMLRDDGNRPMAHGETIAIGPDEERIVVQALQVSEEVHRAAMANTCTSWSEDAEIVILKMIEGETDLESKERETFVPPAPEGNETLLRTANQLAQNLPRMTEDDLKSGLDWAHTSSCCGAT